MSKRRVSGGTKYYLLTSAQNSTPVHEQFWKNLRAYERWLGAELLVGRFVYNVCAAAQKVGDSEVRTSAVYAPEIPLQVPKRRRLAPGLVWCPEMNTLPTAVRPISGMETYGRGCSAIYPHAKLAMESIPTAKKDRTIFAYTTGACTRPNYIEKKAGLKAQFHHTQCALLVEVNPDGRWWTRQLNTSDDGIICDLTIQIADGRVTEGHSVQTISWGDVHASELEDYVRQMNWGDKQGIIEWLMPKKQFIHDLLSFKSASHHEQQFSKRHQRWRENWTVRGEIEVTAQFLREAERAWCETIIVNSNHDMHADQWLDWGDYRIDLPNAEIFLEAQLARIRGGSGWQFLPWAMRNARLQNAQFLEQDASYIVDGVQYGWHGHRGPNGSRGTTLNLAKTNSKVTKGHDHQATIRDGVYSGGVCAIDQDYAIGPSSWSISHVVHYQNSKRAIITVNGDMPWADYK